ncbi:hypothetical protein J2S00_001182 [Caldalkalibacillus uzonensis]|uniref:DUF3189 family protein n=1 Tax=Caldalkalibacillus uzonensis TaxID=353224 RepID=A0ABU0CPQ0_9BACI|nr:DUF3189 family protein [Caldalkalibacillus uzonensis]MDQ0338398.1 hypothetical protein [Caldalkalibacillus uzonensis]
MIFIYNCYAGTHSSALAAAYHLEKLPNDRLPTKEEILNVDIFNKLSTDDFGKIIFHGEDREGNKVYTLGRGRSKEVIPALQDLCLLLHRHGNLTEKIIFSNASPTVPLSMTFGGLFSRRLRLHFIGIPLLIRGARQTYHNIADLVNHTKKVAKTTHLPVKVLDNKSFEVNPFQK